MKNEAQNTFTTARNLPQSREDLSTGTRLVSRSRRVERWHDGLDPRLVCAILCTRVLADPRIGLRQKSEAIRTFEERFLK